MHIVIHGHTCSECYGSFSDHRELGLHAVEAVHESYRCSDCDAELLENRCPKASSDPASANSGKVFMLALQEMESSKRLCSKGPSDTASSKLPSH